MKQPKTIADLKINLTFSYRYISYENFITDFLFNNYGLVNYKIKPNDYKFRITVDDKVIPFKIYVMKNGAMYDNTLFDLMFQIYLTVSTYLFDNEISTILQLQKFIEVSFSEFFEINCKIIN